MDRAFRNIVTTFHASIAEAAVMCSTTPARALGLTGFGVIAEGNVQISQSSIARFACPEHSLMEKKSIVRVEPRSGLDRRYRRH
jgi:hypothetical protein